MVSTGTVPTTPRMLVPTNVHQLPLSSTSERISLSLSVVWNVLTDKHNVKYYQHLALAPQACLHKLRICLSLDHKVNQCHDAPISIFSSVSAESPMSAYCPDVYHKKSNKSNLHLANRNKSIHQSNDADSR